MLGQCQRRWANIETTPGQRIAFAGQRYRDTAYLPVLWRPSILVRVHISIKQVLNIEIIRQGDHNVFVIVQNQPCCFLIVFNSDVKNVPVDVFG